MDDVAPSLSEPPARDWSLLPLDTLASIFIMVGAVDVLMGAGLVCRSWLEAAKLPDVWRAVDMEDGDVVYTMGQAILGAMAKAAVDRSAGQLREFTGRFFVTDELMKYIVERSPSLTSLRLVSCYDVFSKQLVSAIKELPLLELRCIELDDANLTVEELTAVLESCPVLEVLRLRYCLWISEDDEHAIRAKFTRIKTLTLECRYSSDSESLDFDHVPEFDTDDGCYESYDSNYAFSPVFR